MKPKFSIVIPVYNHLTDCLQPLMNSLLEYTDLSEVEVIIVANGCTDGTEDYVWGLDNPSIRVIRFDKAMGYPKAVNVGIQNARGEYVVLLNSDCVLQQQNKQDWLSLLSRPFEEYSDIAITGVTEIWDRHSGYDFIIFFLAMIPKRIFDELGLLEEGFGLGGGEDIEFAIRVQRAGYSIQQVPVKSSELWSYHTWFPIYHAAEATVRSLPHWEESFQGNMKRLEELFRQPTKRSIVVAATSSYSELRECIKSVWKYTSYNETEIIIVFDANNKEQSDYLKELRNFGPFVLVENSGQLSHDDAFTLGIKHAKGERVYAIIGSVVLLQQYKNEWCEILDTALETADLTGPVITNNRLYPFCFAAKKDAITDVKICAETPDFLQAKGKTSVGCNMIPVYFPG